MVNQNDVHPLIRFYLFYFEEVHRFIFYRQSNLVLIHKLEINYIKLLIYPITTLLSITDLTFTLKSYHVDCLVAYS